MEDDNQTYSISIDSAVKNRTKGDDQPKETPEIMGAPRIVSFRSSGRVSSAPTEVDDGEIPKPASSSNNLRTVWALAQVLVLLLIIAFMITSLVINRLENSHPAGLKIWQWCVFAMSVVCGFALVLWVYWPIIFLVEKTFMLNQEVIYFIYGLRKSGAFLIWWIWILLMWLILMEAKIDRTKGRSQRAKKVLHIATLTIWSIVLGAVAWVLLTIGLRLLSLRCRFNRYVERVQKTAFELDVLRSLSGTPMLITSSHFTCNAKNWFWHRRRRPQTPKKVVNDTLENKLRRIYKLKSEKIQFFDWDHLVDNVEDIGLSTLSGKRNINTDQEATAAAEYIFRNAVQQGRRPLEMSMPIPQSCLKEEDLSYFLIKEEIDLVFEFLEATKTRQIEREAFTNWVIKVYQDRKKLSQALNDNKTATKQLNILLRIILIIGGTVAWLIWIDILTTKLLAAFLTGLAGAAFIFGDAVKTVFQSIIFVFVVHPFDIGDRCIIDSEQLVVEEMNILTTVFLKPNNEKAYYPNVSLSTRVIINLNRSPLLSNCVQFSVEVGTPVERLGALKDTIKDYFEGSGGYWHSTHSLVMEGFDGSQNIKMALNFSYKNVIGDAKDPLNHRDELIVQMKKILDGLQIKHSFPSKEAAIVGAGKGQLPSSGHPHSR